MQNLNLIRVRHRISPRCLPTDQVVAKIPCVAVGNCSHEEVGEIVGRADANAAYVELPLGKVRFVEIRVDCPETNLPVAGEKGPVAGLFIIADLDANGYTGMAAICLAYKVSCALLGGSAPRK